MIIKFKLKESKSQGIAQFIRECKILMENVDLMNVINNKLSPFLVYVQIANQDTCQMLSRKSVLNSLQHVMLDK